MPDASSSADITPTSGHDYQAVFEEFWKPLVTLPDGSLNVDQIKRELADYRFMLHEVPQVYCEVSDGRISKPNTMAFEVINQFRDLLQRTVDEAREEWEAEK